MSPEEKQLPTGWIVAPLAQAIQPRGEKVSPSDHPKARFIGMDHIESHSTRILGTLPASAMKSSAARFNNGDVLYGRLRPYLNKVAQPNFDGLASAEFIVFPDTKLIKSCFLKHRLNTTDFVNFASHLNEGDRPRVSFDQIGEFEILIPPPLEQDRIIAKIEELFSELDQGVESLKTARAQLHVYRQAVLKHAFEGKLTAQWREENKDKLEQPEQLLARIKRERAARYEQLFKEWKAAVKAWEESGKSGKRPTRPRKPRDVSPVLGADPLVDLPTAWRWTTVLEIADLVTDGTHHTPDYAGSGVPFLSVKDVRHGKVSFDDCKFISRNDHEALIQRCHPEPGDLLITKSGTIGRLAIVPDREFSLFVSVALVKIQSVQAHISSRWLRYAFEHHIMGLNIDQQIKGGLLKNYHLEDLRLARLPLCNVLEQEELVYQVEEKLSVLEELGATIDQQLVKAHALRQSVLKKAFAGQLVAQDPNDEPASVLLERIKAEKETAETNSKITKKTTTRKTTRKKRTAA